MEGVPQLCPFVPGLGSRQTLAGCSESAWWSLTCGGPGSDPCPPLRPYRTFAQAWRLEEVAMAEAWDAGRPWE